MDGLELIQHRLRHRERQARFAGAAGAGERDKPGGREQVRDLLKLLLSPDEARQLSREVVGGGTDPAGEELSILLSHDPLLQLVDGGMSAGP